MKTDLNNMHIIQSKVIGLNPTFTEGKAKGGSLSGLLTETITKANISLLQPEMVTPQTSDTSHLHGTHGISLNK